MGTRYTKPIANDTYDLCEVAWRALPSEAERQTFTVLPRPDLRLLLRASRSIIDAPPATKAPGETDDTALEAMEGKSEPAATDDLADEPSACLEEQEQEQEHDGELLVSVSSELEETESAPTADSAPVAVVVASPVSTVPAAAPVENHDVFPNDSSADPPRIGPKRTRCAACQRFTR